MAKRKVATRIADDPATAADESTKEVEETQEEQDARLAKEHLVAVEEEHQAKVAEKQQQLAELREAAAAAEKELEEAEAERELAVSKAQLKPGDREVWVDHGGHGLYAIYALPLTEGDKPRRFLCNGVNVEHVDEDANGVWRYRAMR